MIGDCQKLKHELSEVIWHEYQTITIMLIQEASRCVDMIFKDTKKRDLIKELESIKSTYLGMSKHDRASMEEYFTPFAHTDSPKERT